MTPRMTTATSFARRSGATLLMMALATACGGGSGRSTTPPPPVPTFTKTLVLVGPEGERVEIAEFGESEAYLRIEGVRSERAGFAFLATVNVNGDRTTYETRWDGRGYFPVHREADRRGTTPRWTLYDGQTRDGLTMTWDEEASAALDGGALHASHWQQRNDGTLAAVQDFDRAAAEAGANEELAGDLERVAEACGATPEVSVDFATIDDATFMELSIAGYCGNILHALRSVCRDQPVQAFVQANVQRVTCAFGEELALDLAGGTLALTTARTTNIQQKLQETLLAMDGPSGATLRQEVVYARTAVCTKDDKVLAVMPSAFGDDPSIGYGSRERLTQTPQSRFMSDGWFFDPRQWAPTNNADFRGADLRLWSRVEVDREAGTCSLVCGERTTEWALMSETEGAGVLASAETAPSPVTRRPYALARDRRGTYLYVDTGNTDETSRDFRVYRGPRGALEPLQMRDVASDSEGEVFSTARGDFRLIVDGDRSEAQWIAGRRRQELRPIPVEQNYRLIYTELGVYLGQRFELPCDDY